MDRCKYCRNYHPYHYVCDGFIESLKKKPNESPKIKAVIKAIIGMDGKKTRNTENI